LKKILATKTLFILILFVPLVISFLVKIPFFQFSSGSADTWITFWGSYLGALIGAVTVYLVTTMQLREERKMQLDSIEKENQKAFDRDTQQYHFKIEIDKLEEFYQLIQEISDTVMKSSNVLTEYITYKQILNEEDISEEKKSIFQERRKILHKEVYDMLHILTSYTFKLRILPIYFNETYDLAHEMIGFLIDLAEELKKGVSNKRSYKNYSPDKPTLSHHMKDINKSVSKLNLIIENKLENKVLEMRESTQNMNYK